MPALALTTQDLVASALSNITQIDADRLLALQCGGSPVVDVHAPAGYAAVCMPGAVNITRGIPEFEVDGHPAVNGQAESALAHRDQPLAPYWRRGGRSALAAGALQNLACCETLSVAGGFNSWVAAARDVTAGVAP